MDAFTSTIIFLYGQGKISRKQLAGWSKCSLSHVDQIFRGDQNFNPQEVDAIIAKGFELQIPEIMHRYLPKGVRIVDDEIMQNTINGEISDELLEIQKELASIITAWQLGKRSVDKDVINKLHVLVDGLEAEFLGGKR